MSETFSQSQASPRERLLSQLETLYERTSMYVRSRLGVGESDVDDVCQLTFFEALRYVDAMREPDHMVTWLQAIARTSYLQLLRRRKRKPSVPFSVVEAGDERRAIDRPSPEAGPVETAIVHEQWERAAFLYEQLPDKHREVFRMHYIHGMTSPEIAHALNIPEGTVKTRLHKAREILHEKGMATDAGHITAPAET